MFFSPSDFMACCARGRARSGGSNKMHSGSTAPLKDNSRNLSRTLSAFADQSCANLHVDRRSSFHTPQTNVESFAHFWLRRYRICQLFLRAEQKEYMIMRE